MLNQNVYFEHVVHDHPEVFSTMPEETMQKLDQSMRFGAQLCVYVVALAQSHGINFNLCEWERETDAVKASKVQVEAARQIVNQMQQ